MKLLAKNLHRVEKIILSQNKRPQNPETFEFNHKKFGTQSDASLLINCGKVFSLSSKNEGVLGQYLRNSTDLLPVNKHNKHN